MNNLEVKLKDGRVIHAFRTYNSQSGNPRYVVWFGDLGLKLHEYNDNKFMQKLGLRRYKGNDFGGGVVITSYSLEDDINNYYIPKIEELRR